MPEIAVTGRSNVGKSSLINAMLGRKSLARISSTPGKTQTINFFGINNSFYLVDLPGLGYAKVSKKQRAAWKKMISGYIGGRDQLVVVVHLIDSRREPGDIDLAVTEIIRDAGCGYIAALTKMDKLNQKERAATQKRLAKLFIDAGLEPPIVATSATKKSGIRELWGWIETLA
jgi:GTP-binding protein